jgi:hypothetical protein
MGLKVLMPFWLGAPERGFYQDFVIGISDALRELGHEPSYFPFDDPFNLSGNECASLTRQLDRDQPRAVFDVACFGYATSRVSTRANVSGAGSVFDDHNIPYAGMLFDQPFNQAINAIAATRKYGVYPDLGHPHLVKIVYPDLRLTGEIIAPPAVRPASGGYAADRAIEVLYVGNFERGSATRFWRNPEFQRSRPTLDPGYCDALMDAMMAAPDRSLHLCVEAVGRQYSLPEQFDFEMNLRMAELHLRHVFRLSAVLALAKSALRLHVVGKGWHDIDLPATVKVHDCTDYAGFLRLAGSAQICVDASTYLDGVNDRVFSYAVNGAVCFTNAAGYLRPLVGDDGGVRFYSMLSPHAMAENVRELLTRPSELAEVGARAREMVLGAHTWRHRVEHILAAMTQ